MTSLDWSENKLVQICRPLINNTTVVLSVSIFNPFVEKNVVTLVVATILFVYSFTLTTTDRVNKFLLAMLSQCPYTSLLT